MKFSVVWVALVAMTALLAAACSGGEEPKTLFIAGIPDQNASTLARRYQGLENYLSNKLGVDVKYVPTVDYAATVTGFRQGDIQMAWFGGLTGVQARIAVPGSTAVAHRPRDAEFHSKFIVAAHLDVDSLDDLKGLTFTFGSESSTSGYLMPRYFMREAGVNLETDLNGKPNFSGSHDTTWKLVEGGAFQAGALNEAVWDAAVRDGRVDLTRVKEVVITPPYFDYNWTVRGDLDQVFGQGFTEKVKTTLVGMNGDADPEILELFSTDGFVETNNDNYRAIEDVARQLGIIR